MHWKFRNVGLENDDRFICSYVYFVIYATYVLVCLFVLVSRLVCFLGACLFCLIRLRFVMFVFVK